MVAFRTSFLTFLLMWEVCYGFPRPQCRPGVLQMANPEDCNSYYMCNSHGRAVLVKCSGNKRYSTELGRCVGARRSETASCWADGRATRANPESCSSYYGCLDGRIILVICPTGEVYGRQEERCVPSHRSTCRPHLAFMDCVQETIHGWPKTYPNPNDCTTFYTCNQGKPFLTPCLRGLNFNPDKGSCDSSIPRGCRPKQPKPINYEVHE